jgi:hypothetical protein
MKHIAILIGIVGMVFAAGEPVSWNLPVGVGMILAAWGLYEIADRKERNEKGGDNE